VDEKLNFNNNANHAKVFLNFTLSTMNNEYSNSRGKECFSDDQLSEVVVDMGYPVKIIPFFSTVGSGSRVIASDDELVDCPIRVSSESPVKVEKFC